jgi:hypothetical protein
MEEPALNQEHLTFVPAHPHSPVPTVKQVNRKKNLKVRRRASSRGVKFSVKKKEYD